ncbi:carbohydrate kinase family protein [Rhodovulum strictum]|uniref:Carbohydrate kinase n=1 Tax=Rhodovulum strictum TaxID=58314 RepID=A0A844BJE9_9RHOB|nr:carbohydrate kinase [Rhodovulum strictum]MRH20127.1 carbohydrate kinase [Rhodovulum strictum]
MILCAGEALIDMLPGRTDAGEAAFVPLPGGSVFNTAIALGRLGAPTGFLSGLSRDLFGQMLDRALIASGVDAGFAIRSARPTTLAFVALSDGQASYAFYDENTAGRMLTTADLPALPDRIEALFFGGISLAVEPCGAAYEALMLREAGARVTMLDPNIRPGFAGDEAALRTRLAAMIAAADIVKLSLDDLRWLLGPGDAGMLARDLLTRGPQLVVLTLGAEGARAFARNAEAECPARPVDAVDTVGAGDTFNAGILAALRAGGHLSKPGLACLSHAALVGALDLATRAAAITVSRAGANPPWREELA